MAWPPSLMLAAVDEQTREGLILRTRQPVSGQTIEVGASSTLRGLVALASAGRGLIAIAAFGRWRRRRTWRRLLVAAQKSPVFFDDLDECRIVRPILIFVRVALMIVQLDAFASPVPLRVAPALTAARSGPSPPPRGAPA